MLAGSLQVVPGIMDARQPEMGVAGHRRRRVTGQLHRTGVSFGGQRQLQVVFLHLGQPLGGHQQDDVMTDLFADRLSLSVSLAGRRPVALQVVSIAQGPGGGGAHRQVGGVQVGQGALRLGQDRGGVVPYHGDGGADRGDVAEQVTRVRVGWLRRQDRLGGLQFCFHAGHLVDEQQGRSVDHPQGRPGVQSGLGQRLQPVHDRDGGAAKDQRHALAFDQPGGAVNIPGGDGMLEGLQVQAVGFEPGAGAQVAGGQACAVPAAGAVLQALAQQVGEQVVVAVPAALVVKRDDKQVAALNGLQRRLAGPGVRLQHGIAQRAAQPVKDGGAQQEGLDFRRLAAQHLLHQVIQDEVVAAGERVNKAGGIDAAGEALQRQGGQLQTGDPTFGAGFQGGDLGGRKFQAHRLVEKAGGFGRGEAQIGDAQLGQLAASAQARQRQGRVFARGDHQVQLRRQALDQEGQGIVHGGVVHQVVVIQHQDQAPLGGGQVIEQGGQQRFGRRRLGRTQRGQHALAERRVNALQRGDQVGQEAGGIAVALVQRQPGGGPRPAGQPFAEQGGLASAGGGRDQGQFAVQPGVQPFHQPRTGDQVGRRGGQVELGGEERHGRYYKACGDRRRE